MCARNLSVVHARTTSSKPYSEATSRAIQLFFGVRNLSIAPFLSRALSRSLSLSFSSTHTHLHTHTGGVAHAQPPRGQYETAGKTFCVCASSGALAVPFASHARARLSLSLSLTHTHIQIHTHKHIHEHKHTTGSRNTHQSYTQSDLMLSFTHAMSISFVLARTPYAE